MNDAYYRNRHNYIQRQEHWRDAGALVVWPYCEDTATETEVLRDSITDAQIKYIKMISRYHADFRDILDSVDEGIEVESLMKGQAMYVIKCLLYEIWPTRITSSMLNQIYKLEGVYIAGAEDDRA